MENSLATIEKTQIISSTQAMPIDTAERLAALRMNPSVPHYRAIPREQRIVWLTKKITDLNILKHQRVEKDFLMADALNLDECIMENIYFSDFTFQEISEAFHNGLMGRYGEYYGLTSISLNGFLEAFLMSEKKRKAVQIVNAKRREERQRQMREQSRTMEGWGMKMKEVEKDYLDKKAMEMISKTKERENAEHREMVRKQAKEILKQNAEATMEKDS